MEKIYYSLKTLLFAGTFTFFVGLTVNAAVTKVYVSPHGKDTNKGTRNSPFASIEKARDELQQKQEMIRLLILKEGRYQIQDTIKFTKKDSSTLTSPLVIMGLGDDHVQLVGGKVFNLRDVKRVVVPKSFTSVKTNLRQNIFVINLDDIVQEKLRKITDDNGNLSSFSIEEAQLQRLTAPVGSKSYKGIIETFSKTNQYIVDESFKKIYFTTNIKLHPAINMFIALNRFPFVEIDGASHLEIENINFESSLGVGIKITDSESCRIISCDFRNIADPAIDFGESSGLGCTQVMNAESGGKRLKLKDEKSGHVVENCTVYKTSKRDKDIK